MATGSLDANGIWIYGEDDSEATFSALLNKLGDSTSDAIAPLLASGRVISVASVTKTDTSTRAATTFDDIPGLSVSITPKAATSKILVIYTVNVSTATAGWNSYVRLMRGATPINVGATSGSRLSVSNAAYPTVLSQVFALNGNYLDSPVTTSATTYKLQYAAQNASHAAVVNRNGSDADAASEPRLASTITVLEIA
jgi:hypothetical protein